MKLVCGRRDALGCTFNHLGCFTNLGNVVESARAVGSWGTYACNSRREAERIDYWPGASSVNQVLIGQGKWENSKRGKWGDGKFKGTSGIDIDLRRLDIDQCPLPPGSTQLNIFAASDKCKKRTTEVSGFLSQWTMRHNKMKVLSVELLVSPLTFNYRFALQCIAIPGLGFRRGSYRCICKRGFYYPDTKSPNRYYNGTVIEEEYEKLMMLRINVVPFKFLKSSKIVLNPGPIHCILFLYVYQSVRPMDLVVIALDVLYTCKVSKRIERVVVDNLRLEINHSLAKTGSLIFYKIGALCQSNLRIATDVTKGTARNAVSML
ncbi:hypothetical protein WN51_14475 [Melipona quadrifasciata]|uniref:GPR158/179 extracellular domain-containing protein n=1 Tax=Melipona quadrifasciata TaxID=166423 RepID=A0A0M9A0P5_9HYME|nr:hypothetical protein WN51_14475 [Melipona quadrifasciata]